MKSSKGNTTNLYKEVSKRGKRRWILDVRSSPLFGSLQHALPFPSFRDKPNLKAPTPSVPPPHYVERLVPQETPHPLDYFPRFKFCLPVVVVLPALFPGPTTGTPGPSFVTGPLSTGKSNVVTRQND